MNNILENKHVSDTIHYLTKLLILAVVYVITARFGLEFATVHGNVTFIWPPSGISLAAIILFGPRLWPGIAIGAFAINLYTGLSALTSFGIAAGNTMEALVAYYLIRYFLGQENPLQQVSSIFIFIFSGLMGCIAAATFGLMSLYLGGYAEENMLPRIWTTWWLGDAAGILILTPFFLAWSDNLYRVRQEFFVEIFLFVSLLILFSTIVFNQWNIIDASDSPLAFVIFPLLMWSAYRYGLRIATLNILVVSVFSIIGTVAGHGPFAKDSSFESLLFLQTYMAVCVLTTLSLASAIFERYRTETQLHEAKLRVEKASNAKSKFLSRMSHELRTPLNSILGYAQILDIDDNNHLNPQERECIEQITKGGWHLVDMVNDLLDLSSIEANKLELQNEVVVLNNCIQGCIGLMQPLAQQRGITLQVLSNNLVDKNVHADPVRLKQVLLNLMANAIKYNRQDGSVTLSCEQISSDKMRISIIDTGRGIAEADMQSIFEPFNRLYLDTYAIEGTGIGLTIAKQLIEGMGGSIGVTSELGSGSTFWIELEEIPQQAQEALDVATLTPKTSEAVTKDATILYIEDTPSHVLLVEHIVNTMPGIRLLSAHTPLLGLELAQAHRPNIILLDINLPVMDGYKTLEKLRASDATRNIPVIAVSANAMNPDIEKSLQAGFHRYLTKPINVIEFKSVVNELLHDRVS